MASNAPPSPSASASYLKPDWDKPIDLSLLQAQDGHELLSKTASFVHNVDGRKGSYLSKLRLLAPLRPSTPNRTESNTHIDNIRDPFSDCVCAHYLPFTAADYLAPNPELVLTKPGALAGCKHYIAISYCWQQPKPSADCDPGFHPPSAYRVHTSKGVRANKAPASVLHRAIIYAAAHGFRFLWIDQESIDQDDLAEKSEAIQQMDLIYRQAAQTIAIMSSSFTEQGHLDTLGRMGLTKGMHRTTILQPEKYQHWRRMHRERARLGLEPIYVPDYAPREDVGSVIRCAEVMAGDPWHSRAWTLQEKLVAGGPLHFLFPCHEPLVRPDWMTAHTPGNIVVSENFMMLCLSFWLPRDHEYDLPQEIRESVAKCKDVLLDTPVYKLDREILRRPDLARLSAADVVRLLLQQRLLEPYDLLAIIGNACLYKTRLDPYRVRDAGISLSVAILVQSLLNGDMSLMLALADEGGAEETPGLPNVPAANGSCLTLSDRLPSRRQNAHICRIMPITPSPTGVLVAGSLVRFDSHLDFTEMPGIEALSTKVKSYGFDRRDHDNHWADTFWASLEYLCSTGRPRLAKTLLSAFQVSNADMTDDELRRLVSERRPGSWLPGADPSQIYDSWYRLWKMVGLILRSQRLALGTIGACKTANCSAHRATYVFYDQEPPAPYLFIPRRDLIMSESRADTPFFLLASWVDVMEDNDDDPKSNPALQLRSFPGKLDLGWGRDDFSKHFLVCGSPRHFSSCEGEVFDVRWPSSSPGRES